VHGANGESVAEVGVQREQINIVHHNVVTRLRRDGVPSVDQLPAIEPPIVRLIDHKDPKVDALLLQEFVHVRHKVLELTVDVTVGHEHPETVPQRRDRFVDECTPRRWCGDRTR
jgi:hypothetical protein